MGAAFAVRGIFDGPADGMGGQPVGAAFTVRGIFDADGVGRRPAEAAFAARGFDTSNDSTFVRFIAAAICRAEAADVVCLYLVGAVA